MLSEGASHLLPGGSISPQALAHSLNGKYLVSANSGSDTVSFLNVTEKLLTTLNSFSLPTNSSNCVSVALSESTAYPSRITIATANRYSRDVSVLTLLNSDSSSSDTDTQGNDQDLAIIAGATTGGVVLITTGIIAGLAVFLVYKYKKKASSGTAVSF